MDDEYENQAPDKTGIYTLKLYVAGQTGKCQAALANLRKICKEQLDGKCRIEVVDLLERPALAKPNQIVAIPTLVRELPASERRVVGDLSDTQRVLSGLDLHPAGQANAI
ncbi:MAG TPA: circadian clock KaiB family protein [Methanotrichaceae archaeon]|nr:circadian clock KaiB family protein [Methanotrichaceae archaeon]